MEVSGQLDAPAALPAVPTEQKVGWASEPDLNCARTSEVRKVSGSVFLTLCSVRVAKQGECQRLPRIAQFTPRQRSLLVPLIG